MRCQHTSTQHVNYGTDLSNNVTISKAEHEFMVRGGLWKMHCYPQLLLPSDIRHFISN